MKVRNFRATEDQFARYKRCAAAAGLSVGGWIRRAANEAADLEIAGLERQEQEKAEREALKERLGVA